MERALSFCRRPLPTTKSNLPSCPLSCPTNAPACFPLLSPSQRGVGFGCFFLISLSLSGARLWGASSRLCLFVGKCTEGKREKGKRKKIKPGGMGKRGGGGEEGRRTREGRSEGCLRQSCPNKGRGMLNQNSHYSLGGPSPSLLFFANLASAFPFSLCLWQVHSFMQSWEAEEGPGRLRHFS